MRDILISSTVCLLCLGLALISQLIAPSVVEARPAPEPPARVAMAPDPGPSAAPLELDPDDPNPALFTMAAGETARAGAADLGGPMDAARERMTDSGLRITDLEEGTGEEAVRGATVTVHYRGTLENGREFDASYGRGPFTFPLGAGRVIKGWDEGVAGMKVGGKRRLVIPPELAYGKRGAGRVIPPDATLTFEVELLDVVP
jgi:peptidylprolyl isomerase